MKKKILKVLVVMLMMVSILSVQVSALSTEATDLDSVSPRYTGIYTLTTLIEMTSYGRADSYGRVELRNGYTADMTLTLQQSSDGLHWTSIKSWETTGETTVKLDKSYYVAPGYYYRAKCTVAIYDENDNYVEGDTLRSGSEYY